MNNKEITYTSLYLINLCIVQTSYTCKYALNKDTSQRYIPAFNECMTKIMHIIEYRSTAC